MRRRPAVEEPESPRETPCKVCGAPVKTADAVVEPDVLTGLTPDPSAVQRVHGEVRVDRIDWTRRHRSCPESWGWIVGTVLAVRMTDAEALSVVERSGVEPVAFRADRVAKKKPFDYLDADELEKLSAAWRYVDARANGAPCDAGACGWCGVRVATGWAESPLRWSEGKPAPLCGGCADYWETHQAPSDPDALRHLAQSRMTATPVYAGHTHVGMRIFADVAGEDHRGCDRPWTYAPAALSEIRRRVMGQYPQFASPDARAMLEKVRRIRAIRNRNERREAEEQDKPGSDIDWEE